MNLRLGRWLRRLAVGLVILAAALLALAWIAQQWIVPAVIRHQVAAAATDYWNGRVTVGRVGFSYTAPLEVDDLRIEDDAGRLWAEVRRVRVHLRDWPGIHPVVHEIELDGVALRPHVGPEAPTPWRRPEPKAQPGEPSSYVDLQRIRVHDLDVALVADRHLLGLGRLRLAVDFDGDAMRIDLAPLSSGPRGRLAAQGTVDTSAGTIAAEAELERALSPGDAAFLRAVLGERFAIEEATGRVEARAALSGDLAQADQLDLKAQASVDGLAVSTTDDLVVRDLNARVELSQWQLRATQFDCIAFDTPIVAEGQVDLAASPMTCAAWAHAEHIDLGMLGRLLGVDALAGGHAGARVEVSGPTGEQLRIEAVTEVDAALEAGPVQYARGRAEFAGTVPMGETEDPLRGELRLSGWQVGGGQGDLVEALTARFEVEGTRLSASRIEATAFGGSVLATAEYRPADDVPSASGELVGKMAATGVRAEALAAYFDVARGIEGACGIEANWSLDLGSAARLRVDGRSQADVTYKGSRHEVGGTFDVAAGSGAAGDGTDGRASLSLSDVTYRRNGRLQATLVGAKATVEEGRIAVPQFRMTTAGGAFSGDAELRRGQGDGEDAWAYQGHFTSEAFNPLALWPEPPAGAPQKAELSLTGSFEGQGSARFEAQADGRVVATWPAGAVFDTAESSGSRSQPALADADVAITIQALDLPAPELADRMALTARVDGGRLLVGPEAVLEDIAATVRAVPDGRVEAEFRGGGAGGAFDGALKAVPKDGRLAWSGTLTLREVDLARLPPVAGVPAEVSRTRLNARLALEESDAGVTRATGQGDLAAGLRSDVISEAGGKFTFDLKLAGGGGPEAAPFGVTGTARLTDASLANGHGVLVDDLRLSAIAFGRSADVSSIRGNVLGGKATGLFRLDFPADGDLTFRGGLDVDDLSLKKLAVVFGQEGKTVNGVADLSYRFLGSQFSPAGIAGNGLLVIRESQMVGTPVMVSLLAATGLRPEAASDTDVDLAFENQGLLVTVNGGRVATPVFAIKPVPGGTVNLATQELDFHVIAASLDDIDGLMSLPGLKMVAPLVGGIARLRVSGNYGSLEQIKVEKQPLEDLGEGAMEFFNSAVEAGGDLGRALFEPLRGVLP